MREIKFRLWNQKALCMENPGDRPFTISPWGVPLYDGLKLENHILMQYTGLKDKNGKEIYEGDIVEFTGRMVSKGVVQYSPQIAAYHSKNGKSAWLIFPETGITVEVIGNIYENKELLEVVSND